LKLETTPTKTHQLRKEAANKGIAGTICVHQLVIRNACHLQYITVQSSAVSMTQYWFKAGNTLHRLNLQQATEHPAQSNQQGEASQAIAQAGWQWGAYCLCRVMASGMLQAAEQRPCTPNSPGT
jgi:hypothetical protein